MSEHDDAPLNALANAPMTIDSSGKTVRRESLELRSLLLLQHPESGSGLSRKLAQVPWFEQARRFRQPFGAVQLPQATLDVPVARARER